MSLLKSKKKESTKPSAKGKPEVHNLKSAYIFPAEDGDKMIQALGELPSKYFQQLVGPMIDTFAKAYRGDITVTIDPNKQSPPLPPPIPDQEPEPKAAMEVKKP